MASSGSVTMPFISCIRGAFSVLGIRAPAILILLLTLNDMAGFSSMKLSIMSPFSSTVFPSENMTRIFKIGSTFVNAMNEKQKWQCVNSRTSTTSHLPIMANSRKNKCHITALPPYNNRASTPSLSAIPQVSLWRCSTVIDFGNLRYAVLQQVSVFRQYNFDIKKAKNIHDNTETFFLKTR